MTELDDLLARSHAALARTERLLQRLAALQTGEDQVAADMGSFAITEERARLQAQLRQRRRQKPG